MFQRSNDIDCFLIHFFKGKLLNHQRLIEFSTTNDGRTNEQSTNVDEACRDEDDVDDVSQDDGEFDDDDDDDDDNNESNRIVMKRSGFIDENANNDEAKSNNITQEGIENSMRSIDIDEQSEVNLTDEQQINRLRKRTRRRRRRRRRRKNAGNQVTATKSKYELFNINAEQINPQSSSPAPASKPSRLTSESFASQEHNANSGLRVRRAILWIKVDAINRQGQNEEWTTAHRPHSANTRRQFTLWVFHIAQPFCKSKRKTRRVNLSFSLKYPCRVYSLWPQPFDIFVFVWKISSFLLCFVQELNQKTVMSASKNVQFSKLGWQKLDVTSSIRQWYADGAKTRLQLLIDCSGCADFVKIHLFDENPSKASTKSNDGVYIIFTLNHLICSADLTVN